FSSRRRHTRFSRDWSSDVCSSDLLVVGGAAALTSLVSVPGCTYAGFHAIFTLGPVLALWARAWAVSDRAHFASGAACTLLLAVKIGRASCRERCGDRWQRQGAYMR